jgi:hypothetical protein
MNNIQKMGGIAALIGAATNLGLVIGVAGILGVLLTSLSLMAVVYGLGLIIWFAWLGIVMLRRSPARSLKTRQGTSFST